MATAGENKRVLILNSYHKGYLWSDNILMGIESEFAKQSPETELFVEYLDTKRFSPEEMYPLLETLYMKKFGHEYDVVIAMDNNAFEFIMEYRRKHNIDIPICRWKLKNVACGS